MSTSVDTIKEGIKSRKKGPRNEKKSRKNGRTGNSKKSKIDNFVESKRVRRTSYNKNNEGKNNTSSIAVEYRGAKGLQPPHK